jgi:hypothetical protein
VGRARHAAWRGRGGEHKLAHEWVHAGLSGVRQGSYMMGVRATNGRPMHWSQSGPGPCLA